MGSPPLRRRAAHVSLFIASRQTRPTGRVLANQSLQIWPAVRCCCNWLFWTTSKLGYGPRVLQMRVVIVTPRWWTWGTRISSSTALSHMWWFYHNKCPGAIGNPMRFSTATTFLQRAVQAPQMQNARVTPEQAWQYTLHSLEATMLSIAKRVGVPEHHRVEHGHHRQHVGRASIRLNSRDDVWEALDCQQFVVQRVVEGFRPLTAQGRGAQSSSPSPQSRSTRSPSRWR